MQVADGLEKMIDGDVLKIGDKLPSVRVLSDEYGISMGTAFQAYYHLEGKGLIESRPKSGYYVRFNQRRFPDLPKLVQPENLSHDVSVKEMIASIYADIATHKEKVINFALVVPDPSLLPTAKINKSVVHALRSSPDSCRSSIRLPRMAERWRREGPGRGANQVVARRSPDPSRGWICLQRVAGGNAAVHQGIGVCGETIL